MHVSPIPRANMHILDEMWVCLIEFRESNVHITHTPVLNLGWVMYTHPRLNTPRCVMCIAHIRLNTPKGVMCITHHRLNTPKGAMCITHPRLNTPEGVLCITHLKSITLIILIWVTHQLKFKS